VRGGESSDHGEPKPEEREFVLGRDSVKKRDEKNESDAEKYRDADDEGDEEECPLESRGAEKRDELFGDDLRSAAFGEHFAQDRPQADDHGDGGEDRADAILKRFHDPGRFHPGDKANEKGSENESDEGGDFETDYEKDEPRNGEGGVEEEEGGGHWRITNDQASMNVTERWIIKSQWPGTRSHLINRKLVNFEEFWLGARRDEGAYPQRSVPEEQRSFPGKSTKKRWFGFVRWLLMTDS
jgi:hypothetical protein